MSTRLLAKHEIRVQRVLVLKSQLLPYVIAYRMSLHDMACITSDMASITRDTADTAAAHTHLWQPDQHASTRRHMTIRQEISARRYRPGSEVTSASDQLTWCSPTR